MSLIELIFGRPLASHEIDKQKIGSLIGVSILGLDALSSAAYGPEAALSVLLPLGLAGLKYVIPITFSIVILLLIVFISYRQTITGYPQGGGSYTVAKENLGGVPGLIAAAGLSMDYILNVSVAISAGVGALVSAVPFLLPYTLILCLAILLILALTNLRGVKEAGIAFISPTYLFTACMFLTIAVGVVRILLSNGSPSPIETPPAMKQLSVSVGLWIIIRAFASGCTAMTGVETVSNGVPLFKAPGTKRAKTTLSIIIITLVIFLLGIAFISYYYSIGATQPGKPGYQSILSQIFVTIFGRGFIYYLSIASVIMVLTLSANTSFAGFPRVCRLLALDHYLPAVFSHRDRRLVYSEGIYVLFFSTATLLIIFRGITDRLIPLFAIGAFIAFTCSQAGMVIHWWRRRNEKHVPYSLTINFAGAVCTFITLVVIFVSKFKEGAWLTLLTVPVIVMMFQRERRYSERISRQIQLSKPVNFTQLQPPIVVLPISVLDRIAENGIVLAMKISSEVYVVHVIIDEEDGKDLEKAWSTLVEEPARKENRQVPKLVMLQSKYREIFEPLLAYILSLRDKNPEREIAVIIPQLIEPRWYHYIFRNTAMVLESNLLWKGRPHIIVITVPWYLIEGNTK